MTEHQDQNAARVTAGVPAGGQFAVSVKAEATGVVLAQATAVPLAQATAATGHMTIREVDFDRPYPFHAVEVTNDAASNGFRVAPVTSANLVDGLAAEVCRQQGWDIEDVEAWVEAEKAATAWLRTHTDRVRAWAKDTYGADMRAGDAVDSQHFSTHVRLGPDAMSDQVLTAAAGTRIGEVDDALRTGEFFARMLDEAQDH